jgi:hypothetical protein
MKMMKNRGVKELQYLQWGHGRLGAMDFGG